VALQCSSNLHLAGSPAAKGKPAQSSNQTDTWVHQDVCGRLIVRFHDYKSAEGHKADLTNALAGAGDAWKWIDRQNAAAVYPTDFALLEVADAETAKIKVRKHNTRRGSLYTNVLSACSMLTSSAARAAVNHACDMSSITLFLGFAGTSQFMAWREGCPPRAAGQAVSYMGQQQQ
jgi:hypothetical protein